MIQCPTKKSTRWAALLIAVLMALACVFALAGCSSQKSSEPEPTEQTITDMAGRSVTIPTHPTKIMGAANPDGIMIYSIDPSLLTGWTFDLSDNAKKYLTADAAALPKITSVSKWEAPNKEEILSMNPDFIFVTVDLTNTDLSLYDNLTAETNVPVVVGDAELSHLGDTYRFLGSILDQTDTCNKLGAFVDQTFEKVNSTMANVAEADKVRVYYSTGEGGIQTCGDSNWNGQFVTPAGGINVCDLNQTSGFANVSLEQILAWEPDAIISTASGNKSETYGAAEWAEVKAVKDGKIYAPAQAPFSWIDKPTGVNRIIGVEWTNSILYPDQVKYDLKADVKQFYQLFYHYELSDAEVAELLNTNVAL